MNDSDFKTAWQEFAKHDGETRAPARLRSAVMGSWESAQQAQRNRHVARSSRMPLAAVLATAAAVIVVLGVTTMREQGRKVSTPLAPAEVFTARNTAVAGVASRADAFRLIADPVFETESFQMVRLRIPRTSLEAIGVALIGPEVTSVVDVDVIVGGDGLPRAIHGIRPVVGVQ